jgi:teichuronic acid exporter
MNSSSVKKEALTAVSWHFAGQIARQMSSFVIGIVLARLLLPSDFGLIALATVFISITYAFVDSGFAAALIQKKNCTEEDYSTVFYFNLIISLFFYLLIFFFASTIASFFDDERLVIIIKVLGLLILLYALSSVQIARFKKELNFKIQANAMISASVASGIIGIGFAYFGFGVWSLIIQSILNQLILVVLFWVKSNWRPKCIFSFISLKSLFGFGSKLLISGIIFQIYNNLNSMVIAKFYSLSDLGFFNRAIRFQQLASNQIVGTVSEVTFPLFSNIQNDKIRLLNIVRLSLKTTLYISTPLSLGMLLLADHIVLGLLGEKWSGAIEFLQLLCIYALFYPMAPIFTNVIMAIGRSDIFLKLEILRRVLDVSVLLVGAFVGIKEMILTMIIVIVISTSVTFFVINKLIIYKTYYLLFDLKDTVFCSLVISISIVTCLLILPSTMNHLIVVVICFFTSAFMFIGFSELIKASEYLYLKQFTLTKLTNRKNNI